jgi:ribosomal protein S18 acetylase RimI-like enzyme
MTVSDYEEVYALWINTPNMGLNDVDDSREGIHKYLTRNPNTCFIAEEDGKACGVILSGHDGRRGFIYHMAVREDRQRAGIGTALLDAAMSALEKEASQRLRWS